MRDAETPTRERLAKARHVETPQVDQKTQRRAFRVLTEFQALAKRGETHGIDRPQYEAAEKFCRHYEGALGIDVRSGDGASGEIDVEEPRTYHAQKVAEAQRWLLDYEFEALELLALGQASIESIGRRRTHYVDRKQAHAAGLTIVRAALERLALLWGFKDPPRPLR